MQLQPHPVAQRHSSKAVLGAPEHATGFITSLHVKASCCGSDCYLSKMFPQ